MLDECLKQARGWTREEDGIDQTTGRFFMEFSDFCSKFDTLHLCRLFDDKQYKQYKVLSSWAGKTAAGPDEGVPTSTDTGFAKLIAEKAKPRTDKDACWFNNPQFRVEVKHKSTHISLLQGPPKSGERFELCLEVIREKKTPALPGRVWERGDVDRSTQVNQPVMREVSLSNVLLEPGYTYCVVARAATERGREAPFALRVFSPRELVLQPLDECESSYLPGSWNGAAEVDSAGGAPFHCASDQLIPNPTFRQSPQYFLNLPEPPADHPKATTGEVNVTLVLRRTDPTPDKAQKAQIGLCVFRGPAPEVVLCKKHKKTGPKVNALGEKPKGKPSTLKKKRRQAAQLLDGLAGPQLRLGLSDLRSEDSITTAPKKIGLYPSEWHRLSSFGNETVAVLHLPTLVRSKFPHGLVITPCLSERGVSGQYVLELHADCPTTLEAISATKSKTLAGEWTAKTGAGLTYNRPGRRIPTIACGSRIPRPDPGPRRLHAARRVLELVGRRGPDDGVLHPPRRRAERHGPVAGPGPLHHARRSQLEGRGAGAVHAVAVHAVTHGPDAAVIQVGQVRGSLSHCAGDVRAESSGALLPFRHFRC